MNSFYVAYDTVVIIQPDHTLYFSTRDVKVRGEKRGINTVTISNTRKEDGRKGQLPRCGDKRK
jgi:hypothetical protein